MKKDVILSLKGIQTYAGQEPDTVELITDGVLEQIPGGWKLHYEESALTGLEGVHTTFLLEDGCVTLTRTGNLNSQMIFREGIPHESLYQMQFGALLLSVCATAIRWELSWQGGTVDLRYRIEIEQSATGTVEYHLDIKEK